MRSACCAWCHFDSRYNQRDDEDGIVQGGAGGGLDVCAYYEAVMRAWTARNNLRMMREKRERTWGDRYLCIGARLECQSGGAKLTRSVPCLQYRVKLMEKGD